MHLKDNENLWNWKELDGNTMMRVWKTHTFINIVEILLSQKFKGGEEGYKMQGLVRDLRETDKRLILHAKIKSAWLSVRGTIVSGTVLSATEFWYFLCTHYNVSPLILQIHCIGCVTAFRVTHTLICSTGGLVI